MKYSAAVAVQCPKTISNFSNLLCPIRPRKRNSASALETSNAVMANSLGPLWQLHDVLVPQWTKPLLAKGQIGQYRSDYALCAMVGLQGAC